MRKRCFRALVMLLTVAFLSSAPALASDVVSATGDVNVRKGPGRDYSVIGFVQKGTTLDRLDDEEIVKDERGVMWYPVNYEGSVGWVSSKFCEVLPSESSDDTPTQPSGATVVPDYAKIAASPVSWDRLVKALGVLGPKDASGVESYCTKRNEEKLRVHICFGFGIYAGGSDGYMEDWLVGKGIASEIKWDLDGDGEEEALFIYCDQVPVEGYDYSTARWKGLIYEPVEGGYVFAGEFPVDILREAGSGERSVKLMPVDGHVYMAVIRNERCDGGQGDITVELYEYDGERVWISKVYQAGIYYDSWIVEQPHELEWRKQFYGWETINSMIYPEKVPGLMEEEGFQFFDASEVEPDATSMYSPNVFGAFRTVARALKEYGIVVEYEVIHNYNVTYDYDGEGYEMREWDDGITLLLARELDEEAYLWASDLDVILHTALDHKL